MRTLRFTIALLAVAALALPPNPVLAHDEQPPPPPASSGPVTTPNMHQLGHVNPGPGTSADVFGYRDQAYLASWRGRGCMSSGIRVYDLTIPAQPQHVSTFADKTSDPSLAGTWTEKVIVQRVDTAAFHGDLAVVTFQNCDRANTAAFRGFALYDVSDPRHPLSLARYATPGTRGSHEIWLAAHGGRAYVYTAVIRSESTTGAGYDPATGQATSPGRADFRIVDVSNPANPTDVGEWGAWRQLGVTPWSSPGGNFVHSVRVDERLSRAYLSYWDLGTVILDIADPAAPRYLGRTMPTQGATHSAALAHAGHILVETHELDAGLPVFYDISDPANPVQLANFSVPLFETDSVHDPKTRGDHVYFSWYSLGVVAAHASDPGHPSFAGQFVPTDLTGNPDFCADGCVNVWGVFLLRDLILASDMNSGLYVITLDH